MLLPKEDGGQRTEDRNGWIYAAAVIGVAVLCLLSSGRAARAVPYGLPNDNTSCPGNCRQIPWRAGSDLWNGGTLPNYTQVTCTGLAGNGTTDDGPAIQACINAANPNTAVYLPAGIYMVNSTVRLKSNVVLRGAGPTTQIHEGSSGWLTTQNFSNNNNLTPGVTYGCNPASGCVPYHLSGAPQKGDTTVTALSGSVSAGQWIIINSDDDPSLVNATGTDGVCQWCGENNGYQTMDQIVQVTNVSGSVLTLSRPLYYKLYTNPSYRVITFPTQKAGFENFHVTATGDIGANQIILLQGCLDCWVKGVETQETGSNSGSAHVEMDFCYGNEIRDGYYHDQRSGASGSGYGVYFQFVNSDAKVENNIIRHNRHGILYQGGGSGTAILYNYIDDEYTDDTTYLGSARTSHGAHPYMNLWEGNVVSHVTADDFWGTSSHFVFFRNWLWGDETENWTGAVAPTGTPTNGFDAVDLYQSQEYYSFVGNVLGRTGLHTTWSAATLSATCTTNNCGYEAPSAPGVYSYGSSSLGSAATSASTILRHGNWDYKTQGVAFWDGGSNQVLAASMYYPSEPGYLSGYPWPLEGPEGNPTANANAAENCYLKGPFASGPFNPVTCYGAGSPPPPPTTSPCDVNKDGVVNVADVQLEVNMALGILLCTNPSGTCTVVSVQRVVNAALGGPCTTNPQLLVFPRRNYAVAI